MLNQLYKDFKNRAEFFVVYVQEAHAADAWQLPSNVKDDVIFASPKSYDERTDLAQTCVRKLGLEMPALVDNFDNATDMAYTGWPDRLYVIDKQGNIAYKSDPGPFGFHPEAVRKVLESGSVF